MLELAAKKLTECQELEQVEVVRNIDHQENTQYIEETQHRVLEKNDDNATSAAVLNRKPSHKT